MNIRHQEKKRRYAPEASYTSRRTHSFFLALLNTALGAFTPSGLLVKRINNPYSGSRSISYVVSSLPLSSKDGDELSSRSVCRLVLPLLGEMLELGLEGREELVECGADVVVHTFELFGL